MKKIFFFLLLSLAIYVGCGDKGSNSTAENATASPEVKAETKPEATAPVATQSPQAEGNLAYLLKLNGQYPFDAKVLQTEPLKSRLKAFLHNDFAALEERLGTSEPILVEGDIFFTAGCMPHACSVEECAIAIDVKKDNIYVAIMQDGVVRQAIEKAGEGATPALFTKWLKEK
jgi:hypothetical protein